MEATDPSIPLLRPHKPLTTPKPLSQLQRFAITSFSVLRILRGISFIVYPKFGLSSFDIPNTGATYLFGGLLGTRDLLLGGLLLTSTPAACRETYRALLVNLLSDAMDVFILVFSATCNWHWRSPVVEILLVAGLAVMEHLTLFSMSDDDEDEYYGKGGNAHRGSSGYQKMLQSHEDKRSRLDNWMAEMRQVEEMRLHAEQAKPAEAVAASHA